MESSGRAFHEVVARQFHEAHAVTAHTCQNLQFSQILVVKTPPDSLLTTPSSPFSFH